MKIGAFVPIGTLNASPDFLRTLGTALEERGFESVWLAEHIVLFDDYTSQYPYADDGRFPGGGDTGLLEPLTTSLSGLTSSATDLSETAQHDIPLLDTAGAIPTSLLHPIPLQLGFLGQPTMDGHAPHDGAFSALGIHHF